MTLLASALPVDGSRDAGLALSVGVVAAAADAAAAACCAVSCDVPELGAGFAGT